MLLTDVFNQSTRKPSQVSTLNCAINASEEELFAFEQTKCSDNLFCVVCITALMHSIVAGIIALKETSDARVCGRNHPTTTKIHSLFF